MEGVGNSQGGGKIPKPYLVEGGLEMTKNFIGRQWFLVTNYIKVALPSLQNEATLDNTTAAASLIFLMIGFTCKSKHLF